MSPIAPHAMRSLSFARREAARRRWICYLVFPHTGYVAHNTGLSPLQRHNSADILSLFRTARGMHGLDIFYTWRPHKQGTQRKHKPQPATKGTTGYGKGKIEVRAKQAQHEVTVAQPKSRTLQRACTDSTDLIVGLSPQT